MGNDGDQAKNGHLVIVQEFEFPHTLAGRLRHFAHGLAARWAIRYLIQQQNQINILQNQTSVFLKEGLQGVDQELTQTRKQLAELTTIVIQQQRRIEKLEAEADDNLQIMEE
ncbi:MAG: hypothetical protein ACI9EW_000433 [Cellvibrionaceae bacterium]|jgi:hypothetical protein